MEANSITRLRVSAYVVRERLADFCQGAAQAGVLPLQPTPMTVATPQAGLWHAGRRGELEKGEGSIIEALRSDT